MARFIFSKGYGSGSGMTHSRRRARGSAWSHMGDNTLKHHKVRSGPSLAAEFARQGRRALPILVVLCGLAATLVPGTPGLAQAAELVMFETAACPWCKRWHEDLGPIYPKTAESRIAPLRPVVLNAPWPEDLKEVRAVSFTPTFVLMHEGAEVGRITGYGGDELFWFQLSTLLAKLPNDVRHGE